MQKGKELANKNKYQFRKFVEVTHNITENKQNTKDLNSPMITYSKHKNSRVSYVV